MYLRIHRILKGIFQRFIRRVVGLVRFLADYKVITFSILFVILNALIVIVMRNIKVDNTISLLVLACLAIVCYGIAKKCQSGMREILKRREKGKILCQGIGTIFELLFSLIIVTLFVIFRIAPILANEKNIEEKASSFTNGSTEIVGYIYEEPTEKHKNQQVLVTPLGDIVGGEVSIAPDETLILVKTFSFYKLQLGQVCHFRGTLEVPENFEEFDYRGYLRDRKIFLLMNNPMVECLPISEIHKGNIVRNWLVDSKNKMIGVIDQVLNEPQSSLLAGIIFGQKRLFSNAFEEGTRVAGLSHIVAASGYNVTILVITMERIFFFLPKKWRVIVGLIAIWLFAILSGLSSSIVRACIMGSISLFAIIFGRSNAIHVTIPLASAIFVVIEPLIVFDVGFLLSISAVLGLTYILPILLFLKQKITDRFKFIDDNILPTLSCTLGTLPISILIFKTFSLWAVPSNTVILPIIDTTMFLGILGIIAWNIFKPASYLLFTVANMQLKYFESVVKLIFSLNWGQFEFSDTVSKIISFSFLVLTVCFVIYFYPIKNEEHNYYLKSNS